jgi:hypothetical protein
LRRQWVDCDPQTRQFKIPPQLPAWALPGKQAKQHGVSVENLADAALAAKQPP